MCATYIEFVNEFRQTFPLLSLYIVHLKYSLNSGEVNSNNRSYYFLKKKKKKLKKSSGSNTFGYHSIVQTNYKRGRYNS